MTLIVEDGSGMSDANAYVSIDYVDQFIIDNNLSGTPEAATWASATVEDQEASISSSTRVLDNQERFPYVGSKKTYVQSREWPRIGAVEDNGPTIPDDVVHWRVEKACAGYALLAASGIDINPTPSPLGENIKSQKVGDLSITYFSSTEMGMGDITMRAGYPAYAPDAVLQPILRDMTQLDSDLSSNQLAGPAFTTRQPPAFEVGMLDAENPYVTESED